MAGPLSDVVVVDLSRALAGPHAAMMLGDMGARVIKVEHPDGGDDSRGWGPPFVGPDEAPEATYFLSCNRNKESVVLDLKRPDGRQQLGRLLARADVLVENFRPGVLDRLGFSQETLAELNPRLVVLSITGFGHDGPEGMRAGYDQIAQGEGGLMSLTGAGPDEPTKLGVPIADLLAGMYGAYGAVAALHERNTTGRGRTVRTSLLAAIVGVHAYQGTRHTVAGEVPRAQGNHHPSICPYGTFHCVDGLVQISVGSEGLWRRFAAEFGLPLDEPGFASNADRVRAMERVIAAVEAAFAPWPVAELLSRLAEIGVPAGEVKTLDQVYAWEQTRSQGLVVDVDHASLGRISIPGPPIRLDDQSYAGGRETNLAPPTLGQHTAEVLAWLDRLDERDGLDERDRLDHLDGSVRADPA
ncbi:CaiB/BaiF CoA transferase family protein [Actinopolymorpha pittospori]|uniref:Crotonobetainyl-CoA:carnitine CoA-transferase CaiB-like acyl-CoA transferase n=1 Tax=Actinopolymorpha pittospori TaxID=648752 RepID=A0A927N6T8_9ACTN|nr:CoA transferase [Actinopolymorpha pittospori]MBE1609550.1 crotonobetainyl-CoA:carnitine CoA-transferase CaiB-like acyl-CoA transferase [Actinopolymorpha pittospori]